MVAEFCAICLESEPNHPVDNLAIELNSYKFSQNASYKDVLDGVVRSIFTRTDQSGDIASPALAARWRKQLDYWGPIFAHFCHSPEEEATTLVALERVTTCALADGAEAELSRAPAF